MFLKMNKHMKESKLQPIPRAGAETLLQLEPELKPKQTFRLPPQRWHWLHIYGQWLHVSTCTGQCIQASVTIVSHPCAVWAIVQNLLCAMGHSAEFCYVLWATVKKFVLCYGPQRIIFFFMSHGPQRTISLSVMGHGAELLTTAENHMNFIQKLASTFKGIVRQKNCTFILCTIQGLNHPCWNLC
jgi:hypothetical protein